MSEHKAKLESRQVLCGSIRNISRSSSPGLTLGVCSEMCSLHWPKMLQLLFLSASPYSLWSRTSTKAFGQ